MHNQWFVREWDDLAINEQQRVLKRLLDVATSLFFISIAWPFVMGLAFLIWLLDGKPVLFCQERVGERGRPFTMYKFRTMVPVSEAEWKKRRPHPESRVFQHKNADDPRVTTLGKWLRRTSLDELPQLFNVLLGQMSLVGPRPEMPWIVANYEPWQYQRLAVPQGMTGLWQVTGRSHNPMHLCTAIDIQYIQGYSFWLDIQILFKTPLAVLKGDGAF